LGSDEVKFPGGSVLEAWRLAGLATGSLVFPGAEGHLQLLVSLRKYPKVVAVLRIRDPVHF
jgi:hypothetical protein